MRTGAIKWFSPGKGYGFITGDDGADIYVHWSGLAKDQERKLFPGDRVVFDLVEGERGLKAVEVRKDGPDQAEATGGNA